MSMPDRLFFQKTLELENQILKNLSAHIDEVKDSATLNKRVYRLGQIGVSQFEEQFPKVFPENEYGQLSGYKRAKKSSFYFFNSVEATNYLESLFKTEDDH